LTRALRAVLSMKLAVQHQKAIIYSVLGRNLGDDKERWIRALRNAILAFERDDAKVQAIAAREVLKELEAGC